MEATINARYTQVGKTIPVVTTSPSIERAESLMVARRSFLDELPGVVIGLATIAYIATSLIALV